MNTLKRLFVYLLIVLFISIFFQSIAILFIKNSKDDPKLSLEKSFQNGYIGSADNSRSEKTGGNHLLSTISNAVDTLYNEKADNSSDRMVVSVSRASSIEEYKPVIENALPAIKTEVPAQASKTAQRAESMEIPYGKKIMFHTLSAGEKLSDLAKLYSMPFDELKKMNGFGDTYRLYSGQKIMVIQSYPAQAAQTVSNTQSQAAIAKKVIISSEQAQEQTPEQIRQNEISQSAAVSKRSLDDDINNILKASRSSKILKRNNNLTDETVSDTASASERKAPGTEQVNSQSKDPLADIIKSAKKKRRVFKWPVRGEVSSKFGMRVHPVRGEVSMHTGVDIAKRSGTTIYPAMGGKVVFAGWMGGYGKMVEIRHPKGYTTRYAHMSKIRVRAGQEVASGTAVGNVGDTGTSTGYHLHFEVRKYGKPLNPLAFLQN